MTLFFSLTKPGAHGCADSREISPSLHFKQNLSGAQKARSQKSQPNETQRILTQLVRIHQTCKADALKIFHFFFRLRSKPRCPFHHLPHSKAAHSAICWLGEKKKKEQRGLILADIDSKCDWYRHWQNSARSRLNQPSVDLCANSGFLLSWSLYF